MAAQVLDAIWEGDDPLWAMIEPVLGGFWPPQAHRLTAGVLEGGASTASFFR